MYHQAYRDVPMSTTGVPIPFMLSVLSRMSFDVDAFVSPSGGETPPRYIHVRDVTAALSRSEPS